MKLILDTADIAEIKYFYEYYPVSGVTTNPAILAKAKRDPFEVLREIREFIGSDDLHAQVMGEDADTMMKEADHIRRALGENTYVKLPVNKEGLKAMKRLAAEGANITATCIFSRSQGFLAGLAGAKYAAPYVNRIENTGVDGVQTAIDIQNIYNVNHMETQVLAASFKNSMQVLRLVQAGVGVLTLPADVMGNLLAEDGCSIAIESFQEMFRDSFGADASML